MSGPCLYHSHGTHKASHSTRECQLNDHLAKDKSGKTHEDGGANNDTNPQHRQLGRDHRPKAPRREPENIPKGRSQGKHDLSWPWDEAQVETSPQGGILPCPWSPPVSRLVRLHNLFRPSRPCKLHPKPRQNNACGIPHHRWLTALRSIDGRRIRHQYNIRQHHPGDGAPSYKPPTITNRTASAESN